MAKLMAYRNLSIAVVAVLIAACFIAWTFPGAGQYHTGADEGVYYRQAKEIQANGSRGYQLIAERFIEEKELHHFPPPLRVLALALDALALSLSDSFVALSALSLIFFVLFCLVSYWYLKEIWGPGLALIAVVLLAFSPLGGAMARRALIDSLTYLVTAFSLLTFLAYTVRRSSLRLAVFSLSLLLLQLTRESGFLVYPYFCGILLYLKYRHHPEIRLWDILPCFLVPIVAMTIIYQALYGLDTLYRVLNVIYGDNLIKPTYYVLNYSSGPWYRYLVDFMLLSPVTILLAYLFTGHYLLQKRYDLPTSVLIGFFVYTMVVFAFLQMNARYVIILDLVIRVLAALAVTTIITAFIAGKKRRLLVTVVMVVMLAGLDFRASVKYFVTGKVYDPVSYNLLYVEKFIPTVAPSL